jgi:hypothetical protein
MSEIFLAMRMAAPLLKQKRAHPTSRTLDVLFLLGGGAEKVITFLSRFLKRNTVFGA